MAMRRRFGHLALVSAATRRGACSSSAPLPRMRLLSILPLALLLCCSPWRPLPPALGAQLLQGQQQGQQVVLQDTKDPRTLELKRFSKGLAGYKGGPLRTSALNVALLFLGDGWDACARFVLEDLLMSLDKNKVYTINPLPKQVAPKSNDLVNGQYACIPTVAGWWQTVAQYINSGRVNTTSDINFYGTYLKSSADLTKYTSFSAVINDVSKSIVNAVPQKLFTPLSSDAGAKASTILVTLVGKNVDFLGRLSLPDVTKHCGVGFYQTAEFSGYYGGILAFGPQHKNFSQDCIAYPTKSRKRPFANNCRQGDTLATHILARLADLVTNPTQFRWRTSGSSSLVGQPSSASTNKPAYTCTLALKSGRYKTGGSECSAGQVCDLRYMNGYTLRDSGSAIKTNASEGTPEYLAVEEAVLYGRGTLSNAIGYGYFYFLQPYRDWRTGKCYFPPAKQVKNYKDCFSIKQQYGMGLGSL